MDFSFTAVLGKILGESGYAGLFGNGAEGLKCLVMILIAFVLLYLGIAKKFEPLLLVTIAFGMLLANLPFSNMVSNVENDGLLHWLYTGVKLDIYPPLIFMGVGAMTDFGPLIARPSSLILGAAAQFGIFTAFLGSLLLFGFPVNVAAAIGIIGGADGPTAIMVTSKLAPEYLSAIAIAAYSYMALIPMIQPPIMKLFTRKQDRQIKMTQLREVSNTEKIIFPIAVATVVILLLPDTAPLIGMLMLGNLFDVCGVTARLDETAQNALMNIVTIFLGLSVGATAAADTFLTWQTIQIIFMGLVAFMLSTFGGVIFGDIMCWATKGKINPLIGSAGVSAVPMAARVAQIEGQKENPSNFLLMHAMGPNVAGVIGSAAAAGFFLKLVPMLMG